MKTIRRSPLLLLIALVVLVIAPTGAQAISCTAVYGQAGTVADPMRVANVDQLEKVRNCGPEGFVFQQTQDIDLAGVTWSPIGTADLPFNGTYDGGGHRITGLSIPAITSSYAGLFGYVADAEIRKLRIVGASMGDGADSYSHIGMLAGQVDHSQISDVHVIDASMPISGDDTYVGVLIGSANSSSILHSSASGSVTAAGPIGGLIGDACASNITLSTANVAVQTFDVNAGGLVGAIWPTCRLAVASPCLDQCFAPTTIGVIDSQATGSVTGTLSAGGLVGLAAGVQIERSFATGAVVGTFDVGGLIGAKFGYGANIGIVDSYARGSVTGSGVVGGLIGHADADDAIWRSYATGRVSGDANAGGLVGGIGDFADHLETSFWDVTTTGQTASLGGRGKSTAEMKSLATFSAAHWSIVQGWSADAAKTWGICAGANDGYPFLLREDTVETERCSVLPTAPTAPTVVAGDGSVAASWGAPASDGGSAVKSYTVTALMQARAAKSCTVVAPATSCTISGLVNGRAYRVSVVAVNRRGAGPAAVSDAVTPRSSLVVVSTRRSGLVVVSKVRVSGAGRLVQVGTVVGSKQAACRVTATAKAAGTVALRCALNRSVAAALATRSLRVRLVTTFRSANGTARSATRIVRFARLAPAPVVTG